MARPRSDIAERIRRAAQEQFLAQGVDGASLRAIAAEAGTNIGMVYYYFPSKDDLFQAVVESVYRGLLAGVGEALRGDGRLSDKLRHVYARLWKMSDDEYAVVRLVLREAMVSAVRVQRLGALFAQGHVPLLFGALHEGLQEGAVREELPPVALAAATMALGMMPVLAWRVAGQRLMPELPLPPPEELGGIFASILLGGIGAASAGDQRQGERRGGANRGAGRERNRESSVSKGESRVSKGESSAKKGASKIRESAKKRAR